MSKRPAWTYADFRVGDVFVGERHANKDFFVLTSFDDGFYDVFDLRNGVHRERHLGTGNRVPKGYDVYRDRKIIERT